MFRGLSKTLPQGARQFAQASASGAPQLTSKKLGNGIHLATHEGYGPVSSLSFIVNASSRYETPENLGVSHFLRLFGFKGVKGRTALKLSRELDNHGGNLHISANREQIIYTAVFLRDQLPVVANLLSSIFTQPEFTFHELNEVRSMVEHDLARLDADKDAKIMELLHRAAFRNGLGNSLYCPDLSLGEIDSDAVTSFAQKHFVGGNVSVIASNVNQGDLEAALAGKLEAFGSSKAAFPAQTTYHGGEVFVSRLDDSSRVAVAYQTKGVYDKDFYSTNVLQKILGGQSSVRHGAGSSAFAQLSSGAKIESFNIPYSDAGLMGFVATAPSGKGIRALYDQASAQVKKLSESVSEQDLTRAKNQVKFEYLQAFETGSAAAEGLGKQLLTTGKTFSASEYSAGIDKVTAADVQKVAAKFAQGKPTVIIAADDF